MVVVVVVDRVEMLAIAYKVAVALAEVTGSVWYASGIRFALGVDG